MFFSCSMEHPFTMPSLYVAWMFCCDCHTWFLSFTLLQHLRITGPQPQRLLDGPKPRLLIEGPPMPCSAAGCAFAATTERLLARHRYMVHPPKFGAIISDNVNIVTRTLACGLGAPCDAHIAMILTKEQSGAVIREQERLQAKKMRKVSVCLPFNCNNNVLMFFFFYFHHLSMNVIPDIHRGFTERRNTSPLCSLHTILVSDS